MKGKEMYFDELKETAKRPEIIAAIAPYINPVTIVPALSIGAAMGVAFIVIKKLKAEKTGLENDIKQLTHKRESQADSYIEPYKEPLNSTVEDYSVDYSYEEQPNGIGTVEETVETMSDEDLKKEMIRQTMSELGKRSAAARARKRRES